MRNIFGSTAINPRSGPADAFSFGASAGNRLRFEAGHSWCGLRKQSPQFSFDGRVAIQRAFRFGIDANGNTVGLEFYAPEFVSHERALHLASKGLARICGLAGESK